MSHFFSRYRTPLLILIGAATSLSLVRCSPLSLSQSKLRSAPGSADRGVQAPNGPASPINPIGGFGPNDQGSSLTNVVASVGDLLQYQNETGQLPPEQRLSISSETDADALESFKTTRALVVHFGGHPPDHCKAFLGLAMPVLDISAFGWNNSVSPITTDCVPLQEGNWKISIAAKVTQETWSELAPKLQALTLFAGNNPKMSIVPPSLPVPSSGHDTASNSGPQPSIR